MKIVHLKAENVQRIKAVDITPGEGNLVVIGGNNEQGKTSVLDSIMFALAGKRELSQKPVRAGEESARVEISIDGFNITRTIHASGSSQLEVRSEAGATEGSPQKLLDKFTSKLTFDPLAFASMEQKEQVNVIKALIPFDFSGNETYRKNSYDERTYVNRELKAKTAENEANPFDPTLPVDEEPIDLMAMEAISQKNVARAELVNNIQRGKERIATLEEEARKLHLRISEIGIAAGQVRGWLETNEPKLAEFGDIDIELQAARRSVEEKNHQNARIRKNAAAMKIFGEKKKLEQQADALTTKIEKLDSDKMVAIETAALPVAGLSFTDDAGVLFQGIPFSQLSGAQRLKVSLAMGIALNPALRILLIRDGSLLDEENLKVVAAMAEQHDMQVWIERVGKGKECSVIIEDGGVLENRMEGN